VVTRACELLDDDAVAALAAAALETMPRLDVLVHAAGMFSFRSLADLELADFQDVFRVNLRAPFHLTRRLLPALRAARGQVVFVNSSAVDRAQPSTGAYTASKHALRGLADVWRAELNGDGVRVLSVFPGRTATPMQEEVARVEGGVYRPDDLLQPADVARAIGDALRLPRSAELTELRLRPMRPRP
jgi:NAD(P)-dependent dehydrogenase (short-subunit alcohol dehydrogenase family)